MRHMPQTENTDYFLIDCLKTLLIWDWHSVNSTWSINLERFPMLCVWSHHQMEVLFLQLSQLFPSGLLVCFLRACVLGHFLSAVTKCLTRNNVKEEGLITGTGSIAACKAWQRAHQVTGHTQRTHSQIAGSDGHWHSLLSQLPLSLFSPGPQPTWCWCSHFVRVGLLRDMSSDLSY